jgi:uncharacterized protein (TIGR02246 family)
MKHLRTWGQPMQRTSLVILLLLGGFACANVFADQAADEMALREAVDAYVAAFNRGDAQAIAALWSPDAVYLNRVTREEVTGREAIEAQFTAIFAESTESKLAVTVNSVQFISPNVALEHGTAKITRPEEEPEETEYSAVYVKHDGAWLLDRVTEEDIPIVVSNYEHLKDLEWMIGSWVDQDDEATVETTCQWTKNRNFITRMFSLSVRDQIEVSGLQIIGWDPVEQQIRSWVFDSDGGFGVGTWTKKGNDWHVQNSGVAVDGSKYSSLNIISYIDDDSFTWQSIERTAGGELLPNQDEVVVVRQTAAE